MPAVEDIDHKQHVKKGNCAVDWRERLMHQADALGFAHFAVEVSEPFEENYEKAIGDLREKYGKAQPEVVELVTGSGFQEVKWERANALGYALTAAASKES